MNESAEKPWKPFLTPAEREHLESGEGDLGHFDRDGEPMAFADWVEAYEDMSYREVGEDMVDDWRISTKWLGLDHRFAGDGPPLIFETMVFDQSKRGLAETEAVRRRVGLRGKAVLGPEHYCRRYATVAEALRGHQEAVVAAQAGLIGRDDG